MIDSSSQAAQQEQIRQRKTAVETRFDKEEVACQNRFAVTDCVNAARRARRDALAPLDRQDRLLDSEQRREQSAQKMKELGAKASRQPKLEQSTQPGRVPKVRSERPPADSPRIDDKMPARNTDDPVYRAAQEKKYQDKLQRADERRKKKERELAARGERKIQPLPPLVP